MKKKLTKLTELQASFVIVAIVSVTIILGTSVGLFFKQPGWIIGAVIGSAVDFLYVWLVNVGSTLTLKEQKTGLFLLTYAGRVLIFVGLFALLVVLQYVVKVEVFFYSCWGMLIAFAPATFITIAIQLMHKDKNNG